MSVPKSQRKTSTMQYIATAEQLAARVFRLVQRLPKRYTFLLSAPAFDHAESVVYECKAANITYVRSDLTYEQRRAHLTEAEGHLLHVESLLGVIYTLQAQLAAEDPDSCKPPNDNVYSEVADLIETERKLVRGVKTRDTQAYNRHRQEAGERPVR